jgi:hypothetical protein
MKTVAVAVLTIITQFVVFVAFASKPIPAFKPSENIPIGRLTTTNEMESAQFCELPWTNSPEDQNFLQFLTYLLTSLISLLISLMVYHVYYNNLQRGGYRDDETEQELSELNILLQKSESLILELSEMVMSMKMMMQVVDESHAQLQNYLIPIKMMMKVEDKCLTDIQNAVQSMEEDYDAAYFQDEVDSVMPTGQMLGDPPSMVFPVEKWTPRNNRTVV